VRREGATEKWPAAGTADLALRTNEAMNSTTSRRENGTDDDAPFQTRATATVLLGTDAEGDDHVLNRASGRVHQLDAATGERLRVHDLTDRPEPAPVALEIYVHDFVGGQRDWADRQWYDNRDLFGAPSSAVDRGERPVADGGTQVVDVAAREAPR
jgi:hypothetical protein